ncbi:MAG: hypothetical protein ACOX1N_02670 [Candidatus Methanomethylophilaceae archaeon]
MSKFEKINGWNEKSSYVAVRDAQSYLNGTYEGAACSCGSSCGSGDKPKRSSCGSSCGSGGK